MGEKTAELKESRWKKKRILLYSYSYNEPAAQSQLDFAVKKNALVAQSQRDFAAK
jgi:hypothetical protein